MFETDLYLNPFIIIIQLFFWVTLIVNLNFSF